MSGRLITRLCCVAAVIVAGSAQAQRIVVTAHAIDVTLTGADCRNAPQVSVVLNGDDRDAFSLDKQASCHWIGHRRDAFVLHPVPTFFSLRLRGARTACRYASETAGAANEPVANLVFRYAPGSARNVKIRAGRAREEPIAVGYVRYVKKDDSGSISCPESGLVNEAGLQPINDVNFRIEDLRLQFITTELDPSDPGLLVNHKTVLKGRRAVLNRKQVLDALTAQVAAGKRAAPPVDSSNWRDSDRKMLAAAGLETLEIVVP